MGAMANFEREGTGLDNVPGIDLLRQASASHNARLAQLHDLPTLDPVELAAEQVAMQVAHEQFVVEPDPDPDRATD